MGRSKRSIVVVIAIVFVALGAVVWLLGDSWVAQRKAADVARAERNATVRPEVELASTRVESAPDARRAVESANIDTSASSEHTPTTARAGRVVVRVTVADNPWLESAWKGSLAWADAAGSDDDVKVVYGYMKLPRAPRSAEQFSRLTFTGLAARPLGLTRVDEVDDPDDLEIAAAFELATELVPGARLVWAPSVLSADRTAVRVLLGTPQPPSNSNLKVGDTNDGLVDEHFEIELPFVLPRVVKLMALWVGAPGRQWRSYVLTRDATRVEVRLEHAAAMRVLHDGPPGEVVAVAYHNGMETVATIDGTQPIEIADLLTGEHRVWIRPSIPNDGSVHPAIAARSRNDVLSRIARVTLVAGETTDVDLRAESVLDGRGGVRVVVPATSAEFTTHLSSVDPVVWRDAGTTTKRTYYPAPRLVSKTEKGYTYELLGLAPGRYTAFVEALAACAPFDVVPGVVTEVEVDLDCIGFVEFVWPRVSQRTQPPNARPLSFDVVGADGVPLPWRPSGIKAPMVCGTYSVRALTPGIDGYVGFVSESFVVNFESTTVVTVRAEPAHRVVITAVDTSTGAPIVLDLAYWNGIDVRDVATDAEVIAPVLPLGAAGAHTAVEWTLHPHAKPVRIAVPQHSLWTFEPLEPRVLEDGATITLRATAK